MKARKVNEQEKIGRQRKEKRNPQSKEELILSGTHFGEKCVCKDE